MHIIANNAIYLLLGNKYAIFSFSHVDKRNAVALIPYPELRIMFMIFFDSTI